MAVTACCKVPLGVNLNQEFIETMTLNTRLDTIEQSRALRDALGEFATGVTVVTTHSSTGEPVGMTVNSFNSVSLAPPLILWSVAKEALGYSNFTAGEGFAVHILKGDQQHISNLFAGCGADKFGQVKWHADADGIPILDDCAALFRCRRVHCIAGGDHTIILGEVLHFNASGAEPLIFHRGRYRSLSGD